MRRIVEVFEPALCCSTGVCGVDIDQALVTFSSDLDWLRSEGGDVRRYNLAGEPGAFAEYDVVRRFLQVAGSGGLPLVLVDGVTVMTGAYPNRERLADWAGLEVPAAPAMPVGGRMLDLAGTSGSIDCCTPEVGGSSCC